MTAETLDGTDFATDERRWAALAARDRRAADAFRYGVLTTGVYCRPTCASRRPNRDNVRFFADGAAAERAGFRACKRCRPGDRSPAGPRHADAIARACDLIDAAEETPRLKDLAAVAGLSPFHFHRVFAAAVGVTPKEYAAARRMRRLQAGLRDAGSIAEAIYGAGFGSGSRVYEDADELLGMAPSAFRRGGAGEAIGHAAVPTDLGWLLVAATAKGICAIEFGDGPEALALRLRERFPAAALRPADAVFQATVARVAAFVGAPGRADLDLPLDVRGTAFQRRVWAALREIPPGATTSYAAVAARIGRPRAARAVARACAANGIAVAIPCHRVVRGDGDPGGYRWGPERQRSLLEREAAAAGRQDRRR